jgi:membrane protein required for colicin V production
VNVFDAVVILVAAALFLVGLFKGAARISLGLVALVAGFFVATQFQDAFADRLVRIGIGAGPSAVLSWVLLYLGTILAGGFAGWLVSRALKAAKLAWADRIGGASLGIVAAALFAAALVHPLAASPTMGPRMLGESALAPYAAALADVGNRTVPEALAARYRDGVEAVRVLWRAQRERAGRDLTPSKED